ncbi:MAG: ABC transporter permease [Thermoleophilia bacterium]|nr:ABC transporter permease [Thermoleophilia bacterium]
MAILIVAAVVAAMGILAVVAAAARTQEQAGAFSAIVGLVLGLLGGSFFPVSQVGGILSSLSMLTPHAWFMRGLGDLAGGGLVDIVPSVAALLAFGLITGAGAWVFLRRALLR